MTEMLRLDLIHTDGGTQPRAEISEPLIEEYYLAMKDGAEFPPVVVFHDGTDHWLADGFHRVHARKRTIRSDILADIRQGTKRDAILHSFGANAKHGQRRTNEDKRQAVERMLSDREWRQWSDREIARQCAVSPQTVTNLRKKWADARAASAQNGQMRVEQGESPPAPAPTKRTVKRGGKTYTMDTAAIGKGRHTPPSDTARQAVEPKKG